MGINSFISGILNLRMSGLMKSRVCIEDTNVSLVIVLSSLIDFRVTNQNQHCKTKVRLGKLSDQGLTYLHFYLLEVFLYNNFVLFFSKFRLKKSSTMYVDYPKH